MNTTPTPEQLRLAAEIIEKQLPFEVSFDGRFNWSPPLEHTDDPLWWMSSTNGAPHSVRLVPWSLPNPPPGLQWHRADGWEAKDLPEGYRPLLLGENAQEGDEIAGPSGWRPQWGLELDIPAQKSHICQRTRRPLPAPPPEPEYVPLEASDVPPGSALRDRPTNPTWGLIIGVDLDALYDSENDRHSFKELFDGKWQILRPGSPNWEPCCKLKGGKP